MSAATGRAVRCLRVIRPFFFPSERSAMLSVSPYQDALAKTAMTPTLELRRQRAAQQPRATLNMASSSDTGEALLHMSRVMAEASLISNQALGPNGVSTRNIQAQLLECRSAEYQAQAHGGPSVLRELEATGRNSRKPKKVNSGNTRPFIVLM